MKCNKCPNPATLHITEVLSDDDFEELHLCDQCAHKYLYEPQAKSTGIKNIAEQLGEMEGTGALPQNECSLCGLSFIEFRNSGRLGCPNDYHEFRDELIPLLESIHGETRHKGKTPHRLPQTKQTQSELMQLRNRLKIAVTREDYEEAAHIRDEIRRLEES